MKRLLVLFIALVYLAVSSGFTVHLHYCMGHYVGASLLHEGRDHTCSHCGMEKNEGNSCCKDEYKVFKSNPDGAVAQTVALPFTALITVLPPVFHLPASAPRLAGTSVQLPAAHGPPLPPGLPIYLKGHSLRLGGCC